MNTLGNKIIKLRKAKGITQEGLAESMNVSRQAISKWERGEGLPDLYNLKALARILEVSVDELIDNEHKQEQQDINNENKSYKHEPKITTETAGNYFKKLLYKAKNTTNSEEAKRIKKMLIKYGIIGLVVGLLMTFIGFFGFGSGAFNSVNSGGEPFNPLPFMFLFLVGGIVLGISGYVLYGGVGIFVAEVTTKYLDTRNKCPNCGDEIDPDENVCSSCGQVLKKDITCSCGKVNQPTDKYCRECGKLL